MSFLNYHQKLILQEYIFSFFLFKLFLWDFFLRVLNLFFIFEFLVGLYIEISFYLFVIYDYFCIFLDLFKELFQKVYLVLFNTYKILEVCFHLICKDLSIVINKYKDVDKYKRIWGIGLYINDKNWWAQVNWKLIPWVSKSDLWQLLWASDYTLMLRRLMSPIEYRYPSEDSWEKIQSRYQYYSIFLGYSYYIQWRKLLENFDVLDYDLIFCYREFYFRFLVKLNLIMKFYLVFFADYISCYSRVFTFNFHKYTMKHEAEDKYPGIWTILYRPYWIHVDMGETLFSQFFSMDNSYWFIGLHQSNDFIYESNFSKYKYFMDPEAYIIKPRLAPSWKIKFAHFENKNRVPPIVKFLFPQLQVSRRELAEHAYIYVGGVRNALRRQILHVIVYYIMLLYLLLKLIMLYL